MVPGRRPILSLLTLSACLGLIHPGLAAAPTTVPSAPFTQTAAPVPPISATLNTPLRVMPPTQDAALSPPPAEIPLSSSDQEANWVRDLDLMSEGIQKTGQVPGFAVALVSRGQVLRAQGYGVRHAWTRQPVGPNTVFRLASVSKGFAATLTGLLVNDGVLTLADPVQDHVPALVLKDANASLSLRVEDLLSHRLGLPTHTFDPLLEQNETYYELVPKLSDVTLTCPAGDCYAYQNVAFSLIGEVVYSVTGDFYTHQVEKRIFHPLGMDTATFGKEALEASADYAAPHVRGRNGWVPLSAKPNYYRVPPAAGVNASITDMSKWLLAQLGHDPTVIPQSVLDEIHRARVLTPTEVSSSPWRRARVSAAEYALGWRVFDYSGHRLVFHAGAVQGYRAMVGLLPDQDVGIAILWCSESALPAGMMPRMLDEILGLPERDWLELAKYQPRAKSRKRR
ncbi:serine hydrolase domain-containing protein [Ahniella affigens]|nr:serine hydrolase domain-containing protein [Ahniella affigens]